MAKKKVHRFGEVCRLLDVQPYVLRYWETEFPALASDDGEGGQRTYSEDDLAIVQRIKELLYSESFTLVGAKKKLQAELDEGKLQLAGEPAADEAAAPVAEPDPEPEADEPVVEAAAEGESDDDPEVEKPQPRAKKKTVRKKTAKKTAKKKAASKSRAASSDGDTAATPSVDVSELRSILAEALDLLTELRK